MRMDLVTQSLAGAVPGEVLKVVTHVLKKSNECKYACERLQKTLEGMIPILDGLKTRVELSQQSQNLLNEFYQELDGGIELVKKGSKISQANIYKRYKYAMKIEDFESGIVRFTQGPGWALMFSEILNVEAKVEKVEKIVHRMDRGFGTIEHTIEDRFQIIKHKMGTGFDTTEKRFKTIEHKMGTGFDTTESRFKTIEHKMENGFESMENRFETIEQKLTTGPMDLLEIDKLASDLSIPELSVPNLPGLEISIRQLKQRLLRDDVPLLGIIGMGGSGKSTLATALCNDEEVKGYFNGSIVFATVSQRPNIIKLLNRMWKKIAGGNSRDCPDFDNIEDARIQLQQRIRLKQPQKTLVVLDDVWGSDDLENLSFEGKGYKTLITTRNNKVVDKRYQYDLPCLREPDAVSLFCLSAFDQKSIPKTEDAKLVTKVIAECKGLPLALKVIGKCLHDQPHEVWTTYLEKLSQGQKISEDHETRLLKRLETSIVNLEKEVLECFLDMGLFPKARKISADPLLDLGVYVHELTREATCAILVELATRNLVNLVNSQKRTVNSYGSSYELSFIQHDVLRNMAIYSSSKQDSSINRHTRLIMPQQADSIPKKWENAAKSPFDAEIVSFHTGSMEKGWCHMNFPKAKALILNFSASEYFLPPFMESMPELKVLMIVNHNSKRATLKGVSVLSSLTQLKVVRLERVIVTPLQKYCQSWQELEKLSFVLCEGFENMGLSWNFPRLLELIIDHCSNLKELPASVCNMASLQRLSVTNCHDLVELPDDIRNLSSLLMLRLHACPSLEKLPNSICELGQLEFLDISLCSRIRQLPCELGGLPRLKEIDMKECYGVKQLPESASALSSLVHVICDKKIEHQWSEIEASTNPRLSVELAQEDFNLNWLDD